jgi:hypothetical protein
MHPASEHVLDGHGHQKRKAKKRVPIIDAQLHSKAAALLALLWSNMLMGHERGHPNWFGQRTRRTECRRPVLAADLRELRKLAAHWLDQEKRGQTLEATVQVHVAYLRVVDAEQSNDWHARGQFFAAGAQAMRNILGDSARRERRTKHRGGRHRVELDDEVPEPPSELGALPAFDEALTRLAPNDLDGRSC